MSRSAVDWQDKRFKRELRNGISRGMRKGVKFARDEVRKELSGPAGSPPGQPPGKVDGDLVKAVRHKVNRPRWGVVGVVGVLDDPEQSAKGARLAGGFTGRDAKGRLYSQEPRPWLVGPIRRNARKILDLVFSGGFN